MWDPILDGVNPQIVKMWKIQQMPTGEKTWKSDEKICVGFKGMRGYKKFEKINFWKNTKNIKKIWKK